LFLPPGGDKVRTPSLALGLPKFLFTLRAVFFLAADGFFLRRQQQQQEIAKLLIGMHGHNIVTALVKREATTLMIAEIAADTAVTSELPPSHSAKIIKASNSGQQRHTNAPMITVSVT